MRKRKRSLIIIILELLVILLLAGILLVLGYVRVAQPANAGGSDGNAQVEENKESTEGLAALLPDLIPEPTPEPIDYSRFYDSIHFSEVMVKNHTTLADASGRYSDWLELESSSVEDMDLSGWILGEGEKTWAFPEQTLLPAGEQLVVFLGGNAAGNASFSLSGNETLTLSDPNGVPVLEWTLEETAADNSLLYTENGNQLCAWPTPGSANTKAAYEQLCAAKKPGSTLILNELSVSNSSYAPIADGSYTDWIELKNNGSEPLNLGDFYLTDDKDDLFAFRLPERTLEPGELILVYCDGETGLSSDRYIHASFSLNCQSEEVYLSDASGEVLDCVTLQNVPVNGSMGRMDGCGGFYYFTVPSPGSDNGGGCRFVTEEPAAVTAPGPYNDVESLSVELSAEGTIYYTTDGTIPTTASAVYSEPIILKSTGVVRAIAQGEGEAVSRVATYSYFINENHTLPILSVVTETKNAFNYLYNSSSKRLEVSASLALYDTDGTGFEQQGGLSLQGWTSLSSPKKSMKVVFRGKYGDGDLNYDVFGNGMTGYHSLSIRGGQDYNFAIFRNELFQDLALEMESSLLVQESKYCVLYVNGQYRGIYCLKEDFSRYYYAQHTGVDPDTVEIGRGQVSHDHPFYQEVLGYVLSHDMSQPEHYEYICSVLDMESYIDWVIMEAYTANSDIQGNVKVMRSPENGGKWTYCFYDLDWTFRYLGNCFAALVMKLGNSGDQQPFLFNHLSKNADFREALMTRHAQFLQETLSNEHVLAQIDAFEELLMPEASRDRAYYGLKMVDWKYGVQALRDWVNGYDYDRYTIGRLCSLLGIGDSTKQRIYGELLN